MHIPFGRLIPRLALSAIVLLSIAMPEPSNSYTPDSNSTTAIPAMAAEAISATFQCPPDTSSPAGTRAQLESAEISPAVAGHRFCTPAGGRLAGNPGERSADLDSFLNFLGSALEILGVSWGTTTMILGFLQMTGSNAEALRTTLLGLAGLAGGIMSPGCLTWLSVTIRNLLALL